jgi:SynChlorMet cassette radical SAM/SPASM protein ScmF
MDKDNIERKQNCAYSLNRIYFYLIEECNLRCRHCWISPKYQGSSHNTYLDLDLFRAIIEQAKPLGLSGVKLTGGEPLLHPQIRKILNLLRKKELGLNMETNGVLCTPALAQDLVACKDPFIAVSLDGSDARTHEWIRGVEGCFEATLSGIRNLVKAGLKPQVIMTIMRRNKDQMEAVVRLAERLGAGTVKFNIVQPTARGEQMHAAGETLTIDELVDLGQWVETSLSISTDLTLYYSHPPAFRPLGKIFGDKGDGCSVCGILSIIGVLADGSYALCGIGQILPDLIFGHSAVDSLEDVWNNSPALKEIRDGLPQRFEGICGDCIMKSRCLGNCIAQNYYSSKNFWAPYWYCDKARKRHLFPETRTRP